MLDQQTFGFSYYGRLFAYSLASGSLIYSIDASVDRALEQVCANVGDVDRDGIGDLALWVGNRALGTRHETVDILSGADGRLVRRYVGPREYEAHGDVTGVGDVNGDGAPEFVVSNVYRRGVQVISTRTLTSDQICEGEPNSLGLRANLRLRGPRSVSRNELHATVRYGRPNMLAQVFYGRSRSQRPFGQGMLCIGGPLYRLGTPFELGPGGSGDFYVDLGDPTLTTPPGALVAGSTWAFQAWYRDIPQPDGFNLTNALSLTLCP